MRASDTLMTHNLISITSNLNLSCFRIKELLALPLPSYDTEDKLFKLCGVISCIRSNIHCLGGEGTNPYPLQDYTFTSSCLSAPRAGVSEEPPSLALAQIPSDSVATHPFLGKGILTLVYLSRAQISA